MQTTVITGGGSGLGQSITLNLLKQGHHVIAIGHGNGEKLMTKTHSISTGKLDYLQADLSLIAENRRIVTMIGNMTDSIDQVIFCATQHHNSFVETTEKIESSFALDYLSRYLLSTELWSLLDRAEKPMIIDVCGAGMKGTVDWNDLQHREQYDAQKVMMHGSRLNELLGSALVNNPKYAKLQFVLYNPWMVQTPGMHEVFTNPLMWIIYRIFGKTPDQSAVIVSHLLNQPRRSGLSLWREWKQKRMQGATFEPDNAQHLIVLTQELIDSKQL